MKQNKYSPTFASQQIKSKLAPYIDTLIWVVLPIQQKVQESSYASVYSYFEVQGTIFCLIYGAYITGTFLISVYFVTSMYQRLKREMLLSNKLLYIIDFESLKELERSIILKFLQNY
jgi:hypothetical protein